MAISIKLATLRAAILRDFQIWTTSSRQQVLNIIVNASNGLSAKLWPEIYLHEVAKWVCRAVSQASRLRMRKLLAVQLTHPERNLFPLFWFWFWCVGFVFRFLDLCRFFFFLCIEFDQCSPGVKKLLNCTASAACQKESQSCEITVWRLQQRP